MHFILRLPMERTADNLGLKSLVAFIWPEQYFKNPIWFLWCLFVLNVIFYCTSELTKRFSEHSLLCLLFVSALIGCVSVIFGKIHVNLLTNFDTSMAACPFFCFGFILKTHTSILYSNKLDKYGYLIAMGCFLLTYLFSKTGSVNYLSNSYTMPITCVYLCGILGTIGVLYVSKMFNFNTLVSFWGQYSIIILLTHQPMIGLFKNICERCSLSGYVSLFLSLSIMMLSYLLIIPILIKVLPHVTAQKDVFVLKNKDRNSRP